MKIRHCHLYLTKIFEESFSEREKMERTKKEQVDCRATYMIKDKQAVARTAPET